MTPFDLVPLLPPLWHLLESRLVRPDGPYLWNGFPEHFDGTEDGKNALRTFSDAHPGRESRERVEDRLLSAMTRHNALKKGPPIDFAAALRPFLTRPRVRQLALLYEWWGHRYETEDVATSLRYLGGALAAYEFIDDSNNHSRIAVERFRL